MTLNKTLPLRLIWFYIGIFTLVAGYTLVVQSRLGAAPWDILHLGVSTFVPLPLSVIIQLAGAAVILLNLALGIRPTFGMALNMLSCGPIMDRLLRIIASPESLVGRWAMLALGILLIGFGMAIYVSAGLGSGPRDGMIIGLTRKLNLPVSVVKNGADILIALGGWWLGGPLGAGTIVVALGIGPAMQVGLGLVAKLSNLSPFTTFMEPVDLRRS